MDYQLVLQFPGQTEEDFDLLIEMEDKLEKSLDSTSEVDGHDFGSDEMNIFIYCTDPEKCFERSRALLRNMVDMSTMKAAFRKVESEDFTILWPKGLEEFEVT
ncbi:MAG: ABC transporter [Candidatus Thiodiazotropha taylori]|nr:ABC transporter [Candidatus Thiodiazotropha endolucinida]MCW4230082.1 ABC transporter [Candidatus Thiodiazotropha taylori]